MANQTTTAYANSAVTILDPMQAARLADNAELIVIAKEANQKLSRALAALE